MSIISVLKAFVPIESVIWMEEMCEVVGVTYSLKKSCPVVSKKAFRLICCVTKRFGCVIYMSEVRLALRI